MCRKVKHATREAALISVRKQRSTRCHNVYRCPQCGAWHLATDKTGGYNFQKFMDRVFQKDKNR